MVSERKPSITKLTLFVKLNYLPSWSQVRPNKLQCQSVADRLQKGVRLFRYSDWLTRKSILKLANWIFVVLRHMPGGRGTQKSFIRGGCAPRSNPLPFYMPFFRKGTPFVYLLLEKVTPFNTLLRRLMNKSWKQEVRVLVIFSRSA